MNCKIFVKSINKQDAVGGVGGHVFDSGCNPTGVSMVHILCGDFWTKVLVGYSPCLFGIQGFPY